MGTSEYRKRAQLEGIEPASEADKCEVCGRETDIVQFICMMEGPDPEMGGLANIVYICTYCCARGIQAVTGFKAVKVLKGWYTVRGAYPELDAKYVDRVDPKDVRIG